MKKARTKADPSDYPIFAFRLSVEDKALITERVDDAVEAINKVRDKENRTRVRKNEVIVDALLLGLSQFKNGKFK